MLTFGKFQIKKTQSMKRVILLILLSIPFLAFTQQREKFDHVNPIYHEVLPIVDGVITFSEVVQVDSLSKDEIFIRANSWIVKTFKSAKDVIQLNDKDAGKIICKTLTSATIGKGFNKITMDPVFFLITIEVRPGRYRIMASEFIHQYNINLGYTNTTGENLLESYYLLKEPTKKEFEANIAIAEIISNNIYDIFGSASYEITKNVDDNW